MITPVVEWGSERADTLAGLLTNDLTSDRLTADEVGTCCFDGADRSAVFGTDDGTAAVAVVVRDEGQVCTGFVRALAVAPAARRAGVGRQLLETAESWLAGRGATQVRVGGERPFMLWPGVDVRLTPALALFESAGYRESGAVLNMACAASFRREPPPDFEVSRVLTDQHATEILALVTRRWPIWQPEVARGIEQGACIAGWRSGEAMGFACHSVNRAGWIGPLGVEPRARGCGLGGALLGSLCADLSAAGYRRAEIAWIGPVGFYAKTADAHVSRVFQVRHKDLLDI